MLLLTGFAMHIQSLQRHKVVLVAICGSLAWLSILHVLNFKVLLRAIAERTISAMSPSDADRKTMTPMHSQ